jgi:hypothetical protein
VFDTAYGALTPDIGKIILKMIEDQIKIIVSKVIEDQIKIIDHILEKFQQKKLGFFFEIFHKNAERCVAISELIIITSEVTVTLVAPVKVGLFGIATV